ncbi:hypothetical protein D3C85_1430590 [compost metagenome]
MPEVEREADETEPDKQSVGQYGLVDPGERTGHDDQCRTNGWQQRPPARELIVLRGQGKGSDEQRQPCQRLDISNRRAACVSPRWEKMVFVQGHVGQQ